MDQIQWLEFTRDFAYLSGRLYVRPENTVQQWTLRFERVLTLKLLGNSSLNSNFACIDYMASVFAILRQKKFNFINNKHINFLNFGCKISNHNKAIVYPKYFSQVICFLSFDLWKQKNSWNPQKYFLTLRQKSELACRVNDVARYLCVWIIWSSFYSWYSTYNYWLVFF